MRNGRWVLMLIVLAVSARPSEPVQSGVIVSHKSAWRKHYMFSRPVAEGGGHVRVPAGVPPLNDSIYDLFAAAPPKEWTQPDFDDSAWLLLQGGEFLHGVRDKGMLERLSLDATSAHLRGSDPGFLPVGLICQRSRFFVQDRRKVKELSLVLTYRGGFVAYLNGREVARANLPEGELRPDTPADPCQPEAFFYRDSLEKGQPRPLDPNDARCDQWRLRERAFGSADIPLSALRDGVNVLAIQLHRSAYPEVAARNGAVFNAVGLSLLEFRADAEAGAFTNPARQVFVVDTCRTLFDPAATANEANGPIRIVGARNGTFAGQVVVTGAEGLSAKASSLRQVGGEGVIPASALRIRYGVPNPFWPAALEHLGMPAPIRWKLDAGLGGGTRLDVLLDTPPAKAECIAVWLSVNVPKDIPAGQYAGELTIALKSGSAKVPVELQVADWTLPDLKDYASVINIYQSPETLAEYYKVKPWSEAHWRLIEKSLELMGGIGNIGLFIPLLAETQMGNPESWVVWTKRSDGSFGYDFSILDRYVDTALKYHDRLRFICLNVWGYEAATRTWRGPRDYTSFYGARVTVLDPSTGTKQNVKLPQYGTPECAALWRPLLHALRDRLKAKGLEGKIVLGIAGDLGPEPATTAMFRDILPEAGWLAEAHNLQRGFVYDPATKAAVPVRFNSIVYGGEFPDPAARRLYGWQQQGETLVMNFNRSGCALLLMGYPPPWSFRIWMESSLAYGRAGNGRVGGDYWHIGAKLIGDGKPDWGIVGGSGGTLFNRYFHSHADETGLGRSCTDLFGPGPDGPVSTIRLECAREGNQEAEARIFIEKALLNKRRPLPPELARECQRLLDERTNVARLFRLGALAAHTIGAQGWQERSLRLFQAAAEVAKALEARKE